jgi:hypothetical protein
MRYGTAVLSGLILALAPVNVFASGAFSASSDILGISLQTPADQVQSAIKRAAPSEVTIEDHAIIGTGQIMRSVLVGYLVNATPVAEQPANSDDTSSPTAASDAAALQKSIADPTLIGGDHLRIAISPNEKDNEIYGIGRLVNFPSGHRPLIDAVVASIVAKYGPQAFDDTDASDGTLTLTWASAATTKEKYDGMMCDGGRFLPPVDGTFEVNDQSAASGLAYMLRDFTQPDFSTVRNWPGCGTILTVRITLASDKDGYASSMYERLIDYKRAYRDGKAFSDKFWSDEISALQISRQDASTNAPQL